ncbi:MAG: hypothetical protein JNM76_18480 [Betaproteobacteria bacterium]|nr:hypothetical protein [Betaproteobacteria bacterium]
MPARYSIFPDWKLLVVEIEGQVVDADFFNLRECIYANPGYAATELRLYDVRGLESLSFSAFTIWKLAYEGLMRPGARRAIVTAQQLPVELRSALQLMRMIQSQSTFVTTDIKAARAWLGLPTQTDFGAEEAA